MRRTPTSLDDFINLAAEDCVGSAGDPDRHRDCPTCGGTGSFVRWNGQLIACPRCGGTGEVAHK